MSVSVNHTQVTMGASSASEVLAPQIDVGLGVPVHASTAVAGSSLYHGTITSASYAGWRHEFPSVDISARKYLCFQSYHRDPRRDLLDTLPNGGCRLILQDGSGGTAAYNFCGNEWGAPWQQSSIADGQYVAWQGYQQPFCSLFAIEMSKAPDIDNGIDFSDIVAYEVHYKPLVNSYQGLGVAVMVAMDEAVGIGTVNLLDFFNEITNPASPNWDFERHFVRSPIFQRVIYETFVTTLGLKIGDGVSTTSWAENNFQLSAWEHGRDSTKIAPYNNFGTVRLIDVNQASDNTLNLSDGTIGAVTDYDPLFGWKLQGSGSASLNSIVFVGLSTVECGHGNYTECTFISNRSKVLVNSSTVFDNGTVSDSEGIEITSGAGDYSALVAQFSGNREDIALGAGGTGIYDLTGISGTGLVIRNNSAVNDIAVLLSSGVSATAITDGGAIVLEIEQAAIKIPNILEGSQFIARNKSQGNVKIATGFAVNSGVSIPLVVGVDYEDGDDIVIDIAKQIGLRIWEPLSIEVTMSLASVSLPNTQEEIMYATAENSFVDGSLVPYLSLDPSNSQILQFDMDTADLNVITNPDGTYYAEALQWEMVCWYFYAIAHIPLAIELFFNEMRLDDAANCRMGNGVMLDSVASFGNTMQIVFTDKNKRIYKVDGSPWTLSPTTSGYGFDIRSERIPSVPAPLSTQEKESIALISDIDALIRERVDVVLSTRSTQESVNLTVRQDDPRLDNMDVPVSDALFNATELVEVIVNTDIPGV